MSMEVIKCCQVPLWYGKDPAEQSYRSLQTLPTGLNPMQSSVFADTCYSPFFPKWLEFEGTQQFYLRISGYGPVM